MGRKRTLGSHYRITGCDGGYEHLLGTKAYMHSLTSVRIVSGPFFGLEVPIANLRMRKIFYQDTCRCERFMYPHRKTEDCK